MRFNFVIVVCCLFYLLPSSSIALENKLLSNGLEVFVEENHLVPLVNIRITFRAGAVVENADLNGLCHLYEHMLFKGNEKYPNQLAFKGALKKLGVGSWNGGTNAEYVTYYFTIPSKKLAQGLEFWAYAMKSPLLDQAELEKERKVVHNEISGAQSEPSDKFWTAKREALFPKFHYRRNVRGDLKIIDSATVEKLRFIKNNYYVPNNAAIFVAGDINPQEVFSLVQKYYGDWERGKGYPELEPHPPLLRDKWEVVTNAPSQGIVSVDFVYRGPDAGIDVASTYPADVWGYMIGLPNGKFKRAMEKAVPEIYGGSRNIHGGYYTQRDAGETSFSFKLKIGKSNLWKVIKKLRSSFLKEIVRMQRPGYFTSRELESAKNQLENSNILSKETSSSFMQNLSFWWASTSTSYYLDYIPTITKVTESGVREFIKKYLTKPSLTLVWLNEKDDKKHKISKFVKAL